MKVFLFAFCSPLHFHASFQCQFKISCYIYNYIQDSLSTWYFCMCIIKIPSEKISHHIPHNVELALMIFLHVHYQGTSKQTDNITKLSFLHLLGLNSLCTVMWIFKIPLKLIKSSHCLQSSVCFPCAFSCVFSVCKF